jgi:hypothetical protein
MSGDEVRDRLRTVLAQVPAEKRRLLARELAPGDPMRCPYGNCGSCGVCTTRILSARRTELRRGGQPT